MRTLGQLMSVGGIPLSIAEFNDLDGYPVVAGLWRFRDPSIELVAADAVRIGMNVSGMFNGHHRCAGHTVDITGTPGAIGLFAPGNPYETMGKGEIEVIEIFISSRDLARPVEGWSAFPLRAIEEESVRAKAMTTFVAALLGHSLRARVAATELRRAVSEVVGSSRQPCGGARPYKGGLRPSTLHRIRQLIEHRLEEPAGGLLAQRLDCSIELLAAEAKLSVNHFIRAFRQELGVTPYQHVIARRRQRAMALLGKPAGSVSDIADELGFSSSAHFVSSFRKILGVTPGDYREAISRHRSTATLTLSADRTAAS